MTLSVDPSLLWSFCRLHSPFRLPPCSPTTPAFSLRISWFHPWSLNSKIPLCSVSSLAPLSFPPPPTLTSQFRVIFLPTLVPSVKEGLWVVLTVLFSLLLANCRPHWIHSRLISSFWWILFPLPFGWCSGTVPRCLRYCLIFPSLICLKPESKKMVFSWILRFL